MKCCVIPAAEATVGRRSASTSISQSTVHPHRTPGNRSIPALRCIWNESQNYLRRNQRDFLGENLRGIYAPGWRTGLGIAMPFPARHSRNVPSNLICCILLRESTAWKTGLLSMLAKPSSLASSLSLFSPHGTTPAGHTIDPSAFRVAPAPAFQYVGHEIDH